MRPSFLKALWGVVAVSIYILVILLLLFYFNHRQNQEKKHYVKKNEDRIQVSIASPSLKKAPSKPKVRPKLKPKKQKIKPKTTKKVREKRETIHKKRFVSKKTKRKTLKKEHNRTKPVKRAKDLFANLKTPKKKKPLIQVTDKPVKTVPQKHLFEMVDAKPLPSQGKKDVLKDQKAMDRGVENTYLAKVQQMLEGWPAQSDFAGEKVKVHLKIDPTGHFEFEIKRRSRNPEFNEALTAYLRQLQQFGFGRHRGSRTYLFEAEFIAKE